jgi:hypothetical protein
LLSAITPHRADDAVAEASMQLRQKTSPGARFWSSAIHQTEGRKSMSEPFITLYNFFFETVAKIVRS